MHCGEDYSKAATDLPSNLDALHSRLPGLQVGLREHVHMMSAVGGGEGGSPKADVVREVA